MARGFLIGDGLLGQIKDTIRRVDGMPEGGDITRIPTRFESMPVAPSEKAFRMATFNAPWNKNVTQAVTFRGVTATASAVNLFANVGGSGTKNCAIAKDGTAWYLIAAEC